ncbi:MAG: substrate-binding domain-containing protein [Oscillospiraceae bacterium]|nr:substrate-binding domain-containing protein [Oscillospiraceae bacterium]
MRNRLILTLGICAVLALSSCSVKNELPDLSGMGEITAISREEGSGTRDEFENIIGTNSSGTVNIALSTAEVSDIISGDKNAVGYAAYSTSELPESVKAVSVNGISPTEENIGSGKYPLCRSYYLAYTGELSAAETDFLAYVMSAGQTVADEECAAVKKSSSFLSDKSSGKIKICGSTSMAPLIEKMAENYKSYNPNAVIEINATDSSDGLNSAIRGECDIAMSSRELTDYENELLTKKAVARDGIAVIVNSENPVKNLSEEQIKQIYDNNAEKWSDLK